MSNAGNSGERCFSPESYRNISAGIIDIAREVADSDFQQRIWIQASEPGVISSYEEGVLGSLLDDYDVEYAVDHGASYGFTQNQIEKLRSFVTQLTHFADQHPGAVSRDVVGTPEWIRVQRAAADFVATIDDN